MRRVNRGVAQHNQRVRPVRLLPPSVDNGEALLEDR